MYYPYIFLTKAKKKDGKNDYVSRKLYYNKSVGYEGIVKSGSWDYIARVLFSV
jgi:hypothetical protein